MSQVSSAPPKPDGAAAKPDGQLTWEADCDFSFDIPPGTHPLQFTAVNLAGESGPAH